MPRIIVLPGAFEAEITPRDLLLHAGEKAGADMEAGCFNCSCGTCVVEVLEGAEHLEPPSAEELEVLDQWNRDPDHFRLACTAKLNGRGDVRIRQL